MKSTYFAIISTMFYAMANVIIGRKLSGVYPVASQVGLFVMGLVIAVPILLYAKRAQPDLPLPSGKLILPLLIVGVLVFLAQFTYLKAYNAGGTVASITIVLLLIPVFATVINTVLGWSAPGRMEVLGYLFACLSVFCILKAQP